jgi:hypothetical protein
MCIILYHRRTPIPNHLRDCIAKIRQYSKIPIYLLTDSQYEDNNVIVVDTARYDDLKWLDSHEINIPYKNEKEYHMWRESSSRFFYIQKLIEDKNLQNVLTFDNDILLYENPEKILEKITEKYQKFTITAQCENEVVMGMCFIKDNSAIQEVVDFFTKEYKLPNLHKKYNGYPTEMRILSEFTKNSTHLPILPDNISSSRYTFNYKHFDSVFDPAGYGMYIGGLSPLNITVPVPGWYHVYQEIGKYLKSNTIRVLFENRFPYLIVKGENRIKINNLHIHSKETYKYM